MHYYNLKTGKEVVYDPNGKYSGWENNANEGLVQFNDYSKDEVVFLDKKGQITFTIKGKDWIYNEFHEGLCLVHDDKNDYGYINDHGKIAISFTSNWSWADDFSDGMAMVKQTIEGEYGFIDSKGKQIIPCKYLDAHPFNESIAVVKGENGLWGAIDKNGTIIINFMYNEMEDFHDGYSLVTAGEWSYYIDKTGNPAVAYIENASLDDLPSDDQLLAEAEKKLAKENHQIELKEKENQHSNYTESSCKSVAINYLKKYLKNPDSLQIHSVSSSKNGDEYVFIIDYSAMNSFGGYNRSTYICSVDSKDGKITNAISN